MKTLILSIYDGLYNKTAVVYEDGLISHPVLISNNMWRIICECNVIKLENTDKNKQRFETFIEPYDHVLMCEDGDISQIK